MPAISIPGGLDGEGLPIGIQIMGKALDEPTVLRAAYALEDALGAAGRPPLIEEAA
jgi:aspartyl-tRNA(Asn)/glutamyl-tRNA(Gln) amidotransferase subunit A